ncbi:hypothetical protein FJW05_11320 [Mesorhizobium sp. B2-9-1]|nr:hypothetical protein FJW05_11320 [Mesorhizobium sp. B2-9-1]TPJ14801.1 hypothetical protein FJ425_30250 [Mesorhizobium sp. B2-7-2]
MTWVTVRKPAHAGRGRPGEPRHRPVHPEAIDRQLPEAHSDEGSIGGNAGCCRPATAQLLSVAVSPHWASITQMFLTRVCLRCVLPSAKLGQWGFLMKKIYEKPVLSKRQKLSSVVASVSGPKS